MKFIKFEKNGCMPCKKMDAILTKLNVEYEHLDVEEEKNQDELVKYGIISIPTLIKVTDSGFEKLTGIQHTMEEFRNFCEING